MAFDEMISGQLIGLAHSHHVARARPHETFLLQCLRLLMCWRSQHLADRLIARHGRRVLSGLFAGLDFTAQQSEGALAPKLLGTYEAELQPTLKGLAERGVSTVYDVGCAEGYYAVGFARLMPEATILAYDIDPVGRTLCAQLAERNGVGDRVVVRERFCVGDLDEVAPGTLIFMDVEGAELDILDEAAPARLRFADIVVETHPEQAPGVVETLSRRFDETHDIQLIPEAIKVPPVGAFAEPLRMRDQILATWEWRDRPTPWLVMRPRATGEAA